MNAFAPRQQIDFATASPLTATTAWNCLHAAFEAASSDLARKQHLGDPAALGREPTPDEAAIHAAAVAAHDTAYAALIAWPPATWEEYADKSEALHRAGAMLCIEPGASLPDLLADMRRLAESGAPEAAVPFWAREQERRRAQVEKASATVEDARHDLRAGANGLVLRAPCTSVATVASLRAWLGGEPAPAPDAVATRAEYRGMPTVDQDVANV